MSPWNFHGRPLDGIPRPVVLAAYTASLIPLPSSVWRISLGLGAPLMPLEADQVDATGPFGMPMPAYVILLSVVSEGLAFLTVGLVSRWGEIWPRWVPFLRGRRIPTPAAVIPAALGALALMAIFYSRLTTVNDFRLPDGAVLHLGGWQLVAFVVAYAPLLAWGPLLAAVTVHYALRRTRRRRRGPAPAAA